MKLAALLAAVGVVFPAAVEATNSTYLNPVLPGWHSDPSCIQVDGTYYCVTSTFISFPGLPVYASKDLLNWKMISHAWNRESQLPGVSWNTTGQQDGMWAATLRHHDGLYYVICEYLGVGENNLGVIFKSPDPFDEPAWSDPVTFPSKYFDPDLFWDDDGTVYVATMSIMLQTIDLDTGEISEPPVNIWNGTGGRSPEGPHLYKRDGYYYLLIAEGGTETNHSITIARSKNIWGPYDGYENNPILTNRGTDEYFQTVGHGDLFQDPEGNWWGLCLTTRSGPDWKIYPMGRESALFAGTWEEGEWPVLEPVQGTMSGWALPTPNKDLPGDGPFNSDDDIYDFSKGSKLPRNLVYWRVPREGAFTTTDNGLEIIPSRNNLTGTPLSEAETPELTGKAGLSFIGRRQTHTLFTYTVDLTFAPKAVGQEAGITVFLTQFNHIDIGVVLLAASESKSDENQLSLRFRTEGNGTPPPPKTIPVPVSWTGDIRLQIQTVNATHYSLSAAPVGNVTDEVVLGVASAELVSGGEGSFVGSLVGPYATCNGAGEGVTCPEGGTALFNRWRYTGEAQYVSASEIVLA
ncbi:glycoside hydrolase family 43 protein [Xylaria intraflava]|nr:glycoside hydrolase family 43 protein [Xylaria intraflava]